MNFLLKNAYTIDDLLHITTLLRAPEGCPWDREQTHESIRRNFLEEAYEVVEAIDHHDVASLKEELGDVLLQVVFHTELAREQKEFVFDDVCDGICRKLIERHPHIFSDVSVKDTNEVLRNWEDIKRREKQQTTYTQTLESVPRTLPALMRSEKVQHRAAKAGFDYPGVSDAMGDLCSEVEELTQAIASGAQEEITDELGDVLFSVANVARFTGVDSEQALTQACDKFMTRFAKVEKLAAGRGIVLSDSDMDTLNTLWREAKIKD